MNLIIYESSSFGGCYNYSIELFKAYKANELVNKCSLILPWKSNYRGIGVAHLLLNDRTFNFPLISKFLFLFRQCLNPIILFFYLLFRPVSIVILNDFEQTTAFLWAPLYRLFLRKHRFAVVLHDPDRDAYPPSKSFSEFNMKQLMAAMHLALYHEFLPDKSYYKPNGKTKYLSVPHGIYPPAPIDRELFQWLLRQKPADNYLVISILGNIRSEKNYQLAIDALCSFPDLILLIAGSPANSEVNTSVLKQQAQTNGVSDRIIWIEKFLSDSEMSASIEASDIILLNYSSSFTSQSGILNQVAPFKKKLIVSNLHSGLTSLIKKFELGILCEPDSLDGLQIAVQTALESPVSIPAWDNYITFASWDNHINIVLQNIH